MPKVTKFIVAQPRPPTDPYVSTLLGKIIEGKRVLSVPKGEMIFAQGDNADAIFFIESGRVKISVVSSGGKEGVLGLLGPHEFFGEGSLVGQIIRLHSVTVVETATLFQVEKRAMLRALRDQQDLSEQFTAVLLSRTMDLQEDLCDQLFNDSEKRLARVLIKIALMDELNPSDARIATLSHETLAEMVGTTRSRVTHFMNKFRKLGLIEYKGHLMVKAERLTEVVLNDDSEPGDKPSFREH
jgi:CRP/FNR family transcriptional regulator, cyclic AMP receptor protein